MYTPIKCVEFRLKAFKIWKCICMYSHWNRIDSQPNMSICFRNHVQNGEKKERKNKKIKLEQETEREGDQKHIENEIESIGTMSYSFRQYDIPVSTVALSCMHEWKIEVEKNISRYTSVVYSSNSASVWYKKYCHGYWMI